MSVADFHCDLLWYLSNDSRRTVNDVESQCSIPLLNEGGVAIQTFPIYTVRGNNSVWWGERQFKIYERLAQTIKSRLAIENASGFCLENEPLEQGLKRVEEWHAKHPLAYISLTWNEENRFGGGAETSVGLKPDGEKLLEFMKVNGIPVDLSHTSDALARDILMQDVKPIASHSNFRSICNHARNLPDEFAKECLLIGLNMVRHFVGKAPADLIQHIEHAKKLGIEDRLCLGTDFFGELDVEQAKAHMKPYFFEGYSTSACFPKIRALLQNDYSEEFIENLMYHRLNHFLELQ